MPEPVRPRVLLPLLAVLAATGCSGDPAGSSTTSPSSAAATGSTEATSSAPSPSPSASGLPGILEFGLSSEEFTDKVERTQALMAECMAAAGFEYVPVDVQTIVAAQARVRTEPGYTRQTFKEKWGFAISTRFDNVVRTTGLGPQNVRIMESLGEADRVAYERTLWGDNPLADFAFTLDEEDFSSTDGCTREAVAQVFTAEQLEGTYSNPKDVLVDNDPRIVEARRNWSACMGEKGYEYEEDQDEIIEEYEDRLAELTEGDDPATLTGERAAALKELQEEEVAVAVADLECQVEHSDAVYDKVEIEVFGRPVSG
jgi:hypothetical protein